MRTVALVLISLLPNPIKRYAYRLIGYRINSMSKIGFFTILDVQDKAVLDYGCKIGSFCFIKTTHFKMDTFSRIASGTYVNVPKVSLGKDSIVSSGVIIRSGHVCKVSELVVGDLVHIFPFVNIDCSRKVEIRREAGIGPKCDIYTHSSYKSVLDGYPVTYGDVIIGERVELTYDVFVAPGVKIGDDAICAYGSYVNKDIPPGVMAAGTPAVIKRTKEQVTQAGGGLEAREILEEIIKDYAANSIYLNGRKPLPVCLSISENISVEKEGVAYILMDSIASIQSATRYAIFDIRSQTCVNHKLDSQDFAYLRKFLSRYGIRFVTGKP